MHEQQCSCGAPTAAGKTPINEEHGQDHEASELRASTRMQMRIWSAGAVVILQGSRYRAVASSLNRDVLSSHLKPPCTLIIQSDISSTR